MLVTQVTCYSHVLYGATEGVCGGIPIQGLLAQSKVCQHYVTFPVEHDVLWLQVPTAWGDQVRCGHQGQVYWPN